MTTFLRLPAVQARVGLSKSSIYARVQQGEFPSPVALGGRSVAWISAEIDAWIEERIAKSRDLNRPGACE
jgi:prophage regulatory protein